MYAHLMRRIFFGCLFIFISASIHGQILFTEECFTGGAMAVGINVDGGSGTYVVPYHWEDHYIFRKAYVVTYRYGRPAPHATKINGVDVPWGPQNQVSPELPEGNPLTTWFAAHVQPLDSIPNLSSGMMTLEFPPQQFYDHAWNWAWCSMYVVILYESPLITKEVCTRIYIADQRQDKPQLYTFDKPTFLNDTPVAFSIFASRLTVFYNDRSRIKINNIELGQIWGEEMFYTHGTQGHFYYENAELYGMNNDTANTGFHQYDGLARINEYLIPSQPVQTLLMNRVTYVPYWDGNLHPAVTLTYSPSCEVPESAVDRHVTFCRGDTAQLTAAGYDRYEWTPGIDLSDSTTANPLCFADSSRWYRVRMWDDDGATCPQTIPVFVEVDNIPRPKSLEVKNTACPQNTGRIAAVDVPGKKPITYTLNGQTNTVGEFTNLAPCEYDLAIATAHGCTWDTTVSILLKPIQTAAFTPNPEGGYSPLEVFFQNESTGATSYRWLVDGVPIRNNENFRYLFPEPGTYEVMLLAFFGDSTCADTARYTLFVLPGLEIAVPNIITPNNDGKNDALIAQIAGVASIRWEVYNRWGNRLFGGEAIAPNGSLEMWRPAPEEFPQGVYSVVISAIGESGQVREFVVQVMVK